MASHEHIINPVVFWDGVEQPDIESVDYTTGYNKTLVRVLSKDGKRVKKQREAPNYSGTLTVAVSQDDTATDWESLSNSDTEGTLTVSKTASRRLLFMAVSIGEVSASNDGRQLSVPWVAVDMKKVG